MFVPPPPPVMQSFFPEHMISDSADVTKGTTSSDLVQVWGSKAFKNIKFDCLHKTSKCLSLLKNWLKCGSCPEIQDFLHVREGGKKSWKKLYYILRRSGLYCSNKGQSKVPHTNAALYLKNHFSILYIHIIFGCICMFAGTSTPAVCRRSARSGCLHSLQWP